MTQNSLYRILLIEDDLVTATIESELLLDYGYQVVHKSTGEEALEFLNKENDINLILSDIDLGAGISGTDAAMKILEKYNLPIVFLSSHTEKEVVEKAGNVSSYGYVVKNTGITVLDAAIKMAWRLHNSNLELTQKQNTINRKNMELESTIQKLHSAMLVAKKLSTAVENSPSSIIITDFDGNIEYVNPLFLELTGYLKDEVIGENPRIFSAKQTPIETYQELWNTIKSGQIWKGELINKKKSGEIYWEMASIAPILDESGNICNFVAIKENITKQKKSEKAINEVITMFNHAENLSNSGSWVWDIADDIIHWSKGLYSVLGLPFDEVPPSYQTLQKFYTSRSWEVLNLAVNKAIKTGEGYNLVLEMVRKDGNIRKIRTIGETVRENDKTIQLHGIVQDIT